MKPRLSRALALGLLGGPLLAQQDTPRLPSTDAASVLVDVVVRDGKGRPVTDLVAADFEVLEDGTLQVIGPFDPPRGEGRSAAEADRAPNEPGAETQAAPSASTAATTGLETIAFVFDGLSASGRVAAQKAARAYLETRPRVNVGVFSIEGTLVVLQEFTTDGKLALAAIDDMSSRVAHAGGSRVERERALVSGRVKAARMRQVAAQNNPGGGGDPAFFATATLAAARASVAQAAEEMFQNLQRDAAGFTTANALTALVDALRTVPGRKAIVLFSGGLYRTEGTENRFLSVIHAANRASVAVYTIEAEGLQGISSETVTAAGVQATANVSLVRQESGVDGGGGAYTRDLEGAEDLVKFNPRSSLLWIAEGTGGTFLRDTNDLEGGLSRIGSDLRSYYVLGYTPKNDQWDGRFRKIAVRVKRKGLEVHARSGYFAVRSAGPVLAHVAPALAILERGSRPRAIGLTAEAIPFPDPEGVARASVAVSVRATEVARIAGKGKGRLDVTLLARVLNEKGRPLDAMSRRFVVDRAKATADLLLLRDTWLPPGRYRLEAVAYDAAGGAGTAAFDFEVGAGSRVLDRAQAVIVRAVVPAAQASVELETAHPLLFGDVVLLPLAGEPLSSRPPRPLVVQVTVPPSRDTPVPTGNVSVWNGTKSVGQSGLRWAGPDASGFLRHVAEVPVGALGPGRYEMRVALTDVATERVLTVPFTVAE